MMLAVVAAVHVAATDRFYIEDFTINPGETVEVSILLENELEYTAFQSDLYLPEGLTVEQENGYYVIDLSSRKARSHVLYTALQPDGAIRLLCYSGSVSPFKGSSGALVYLNIVASDDFSAPATITLKNTRLGTTAGEEIFFPEESCTVSAENMSLLGDVDGDGRVTIGDVTDVIDYLINGTVDGINLANADINGDGKVNIGDVADIIDILILGT